MFGGVPTSIDNMSPGNLFIRNLSAIPIAPGVVAHSIIAVDSDGPLDEGGDGIVKYKSAHIDGVASEKIVRSGHSVQGNPEAIQEIKRILIEQANGLPDHKKLASRTQNRIGTTERRPQCKRNIPGWKFGCRFFE